MGRSTDITYVKNINTALALLQQNMSRAEAVRTLSRLQGLSRRHCYRGLSIASQLSEPLLVPDSKVAMTIKISERLLGEVREQAVARGDTLSGFVSAALERFCRSSHGSEKS